MSYPSVVQSDSPLFYWKMNETSGLTLAATVGGTAITLGVGAAKPTMGVTGAYSHLGTAIQSDGTDDFASVALNLSAYSALAVEWWMYWPAYANDDDLAMEFTGNANTNAGWLVDPNNSAGTFGVQLGNAGSAADLRRWARPTAAAWHHYVLTMNRAAASGSQLALYVDGALVTPSSTVGAVATGNFANSTLFLFDRSTGSGLFGACRMQHLAIYQSLSTTQISTHYAARYGDEGPFSPGRPPGRSEGVSPYDRSQFRRRRRK